uniref:Peroxidase n=1 Tax=Strigamia maritima TaxID=126957 RepID=T1IMR5_STRMM
MTLLVLVLFCILCLSVQGDRVVRQTSCPRLKYRSIDGSCNNLNNNQWGQTGTTFFRFLPPHYADNRGAARVAVAGNQLPGARVVSLNLVRDVDDEHQSASHMLMQWGQFVNHDVTKKRTKSDACCDDGQNPSSANFECMAIIVPPGDGAFSRKRCLGFTRSAFVMVNGRREQINDVTGFIDASPIYGSTEGVSRSLRDFRGGRLKSRQNQFGKELLPTKQSDPTSIDAGDTRTNMIPSLVSIQTLLLRLHNNIASEFSRINPQWNDETLFQESRRVVVALVQQITYSEFLPVVLASNIRDIQLQNNGHFNGYDPTLNPSIDNAFAVAAYRFGHSLVRSRLARFTPDLTRLPSPPLSDEFFNVSSIMRPGAVDAITIGLLTQKCQRSDSNFSPEIHHRLFSVDGSGSDLYAINVQRGRDHGVPGYVFWRQMCGLSAPRNFQELRGFIRADALAALERVYSNVQDIDLYVGGMAEVIDGGMVGPTFACILARQFRNLKSGDRFWYENSGQPSSFNTDQLQEIRKVSLARIICDTTEDLQRIQSQVMRVAGPGNSIIPCQNLPSMDLRAWTERDPNRGRGQTGFQDENQLFQNEPNTRQNPTPRPQVIFNPPSNPIRQPVTPRPAPIRRPVIQQTPRPQFPFRSSTNCQFPQCPVTNTPFFSTPRPFLFQTSNLSPRPPFRQNPTSNDINFQSSHQAAVGEFLRDSPNTLRLFFNDQSQSSSRQRTAPNVAFRVPGLAKDGVEDGPFGFVVRF